MQPWTADCRRHASRLLHGSPAAAPARRSGTRPGRERRAPNQPACCNQRPSSAHDHASGQRDGQPARAATPGEVKWRSHECVVDAVHLLGERLRDLRHDARVLRLARVQRELLRHIRREVEQQRRIVPSDVPLVALRHTAIGTTTIAASTAASKSVVLTVQSGAPPVCQIAL